LSSALRALASAYGFTLHLEPRAAGGVIARLRLGGEGPLPSGQPSPH